MSSDNQLHLSSVIGFCGTVLDGLIVHPDGEHVIFPLGSTVVMRNRNDPGSQKFFRGHTDMVSCIALSRSGRYLASGQVTHMGFSAPILVWDLETGRVLHKMSLHKVKVQALSFSCDDRFLASLGGADDNSLVLWDVESGESICGSPTHNDFTQHVKCFNRNAMMLVTAGNYNLQVWEYDEPNNKLRPTDVRVGNLQRIFSSLVVDEADQFIYAGSKSGDVMQISAQRHLLRNTGPAKKPVSLGVTSMAVAPDGLILIGGGDGSLALLSPGNGDPNRKLPLSPEVRLGATISSIAVDERSFDGRKYVAFVGLANSEIFRVTVSVGEGKLQPELILTSHDTKINGLAFPFEYSELFATCGVSGIRIWHLATCRELLRITVPNLDCKCVAFSDDGRCVLSGWSDGKVRAFAPQTGRLLFTIHDAHHKAVTAIVGTSDSTRILTGGEDGLVRVWRITETTQTLLASMKDHKGPVNCIRLRNGSDNECVTASSDGSCIIWELTTYRRRTSLFSNTFFKSATYHPDDSQIVTCGSDRKIAFWDTYDGEAIRIIDGSDSEQINSICTDRDGELIVTAGDDKLVKLWGYDFGACVAVGMGHSGSVQGAMVTPDKSKIVSVGAEGAIMIWDLPAIDLEALKE